MVAAGWRLGAGNPCLGEPGRETQSAGIIQLQSQEGAASQQQNPLLILVHPKKTRVCPPSLWKCLDTRGCGKMGISPRSGESCSAWHGWSRERGWEAGMGQGAAMPWVGGNAQGEKKRFYCAGQRAWARGEREFTHHDCIPSGLCRNPDLPLPPLLTNKGKEQTAFEVLLCELFLSRKLHDVAACWCRVWRTLLPCGPAICGRRKSLVLATDVPS